MVFPFSAPLVVFLAYMTLEVPHDQSFASRPAMLRVRPSTCHRLSTDDPQIAAKCQSPTIIHSSSKSISSASFALRYRLPVVPLPIQPRISTTPPETKLVSMGAENQVPGPIAKEIEERGTYGGFDIIRSKDSYSVYCASKGRWHRNRNRSPRRRLSYGSGSAASAIRPG
ncbi:hypothetical protein DL95DRAFT_389618 [Leptodontidium sp. 2 PMI_412]|nr:hypothetical protein DL95DRAFT_389618 [Leptodontidium sp. 2 PMI_412]